MPRTALDPLLAGTDGALAANAIRNPPNPICVTSPSGSSNTTTDCGALAPHNETSIAVNPSNPANLVGGANDYELLITGGHEYVTLYTRAHVTFDGGLTWAMVDLGQTAYDFTGDPAVAFDADGRAYLATLGTTQSQSCCGSVPNPDVIVSTSSDGGRDWGSLSRVALGGGSTTSPAPGVFNDKEEIAAWGHGNAIITWTAFLAGKGGAYAGSPILASVTHDGGRTWSAGVEISGSASFCLGVQGDNRCNADQMSVPAVATDGSVYVSFINSSDPTMGRDQYLVVKVDPTTGAAVGGPHLVGRVFDGITDYPISSPSSGSRETYQDSQFRSWAIGPIAADPTDASHLAMAWSDMRDSTLPAPTDPYLAKTNSDIIVTQSFDAGASWSVPTALALPNDQFQPWAVYDASGRLRIGFYDRRYDPLNHAYGYTLASETAPGSLAFAYLRLSTVLSDPTQGDRWFSGPTPNPAFPHPTVFLGDYSGIAARGTGVAALWTDMRTQVCFTTRCGSGEDAEFAFAN